MRLKYSRYNSFLKIKEKHSVIYNAFTQQFLIVKGHVGIIPVADSLFNDTDSYCVYIKKMQDGGMVVPESIDEVELLRQRIEDIDNDNSEFILHINPTLDCNFNCWYCYENHIRGSVMSENVVDNVRMFIKRKIEDNAQLKTFHIGFFGGEPFLRFNEAVKPILLYAKKECESGGIKLSCHFTTNGSLIDKDSIRFLKDYDTGFQITLDGGEAYHDKVRFHKGGRGSYRDIMEAVKHIAKEGMRVILRINFTSENIDSIYEIVDDFTKFNDEYKRYVSIDLQRVWQDRSSCKDTTEEKASEIRRRFKETGFSVHANYIPSNVVNSCYGDKRNHILINYDGRAYACTARDFNEENSIGILGADGFVVYKEGVVRMRDAAKFSKPVCHKCRIAPLCGGGCRQRALESDDDDKCIFGYSEADKDNIVMDIFEKSFLGSDKQEDAKV